MAEVAGDSVCLYCSSTDIETDYSKGQSYCTNCGAFQEQELITNSLQYETGPSGHNTQAGRTVRLDTQGYLGQTGNPLKGGIARSSKETTLQRNEDRLRGLGSLSKCDAAVCMHAFRIYRMAYDAGMTRKRSIDVLLSACLYISSRRCKTGHMLADFVPHLPGDIFDLAKTVRFLVTRLCIDVPMQNPVHQVERFCNALVEDKVLVQKLVTMARKIVERMRMDWIDAGRKPSAVAAAAVIIACRVYNYEVDLETVASVAQVAGVTIRRRLIEFARTQSARYMPSQFGTPEMENLPRAQYHPAIFQARKGKTSGPWMVQAAERKKYALCLRQLLAAIIDGLKDENKYNDEQWSDLGHSLIVLNTTLEMVESRWKLSYEKSLFIATNLRPAITDEEYETGKEIVCHEYLHSLMCNQAEQKIRYLYLNEKHGDLLTKRAEKKREMESEEATGKSKRSTRRRTGKAAHGPRQGEPKPSEVVQTSTKVDYDRFNDYLKNFDGTNDDF
ncbi:transcription factor IIIB 90 kDa subunit-like [Paramacrobiotus metropolitanus]|uniref:transcription factor IIIB 90 kDa subunit-like n=1 Tax=Paramacrobiotus metropolitanus TaxID=2943436 RepID=UPI00244620FD|nr:transcription factor IIIB 90 kDa subunit-like [Paramacrobiotus metropolitanus]